MSAKEEEKEGAAEGEAKPKGKKKLFIIIAIVLLLVGGGAAFMLMGGNPEKKEGEEAEEPKEEEKHYETAKLDTFIVNLSENTTFLKTTILVEYDPALLHPKGEEHGSEGGEASGGGHGSGGGGESAEAALPAEILKRKPMIHDAIIRVLSSKRSVEVLSPEGKELLKQELLEAINEAIGLEEGPVVNIYFTEFIIQ